MTPSCNPTASDPHSLTLSLILSPKSFQISLPICPFSLTQKSKSTMASPISHGSVMLCFCIVLFVAACSDAQVEESRLEAAFEWPSATMASLYEAMDEDEEDGDGAFARRSLFWRTMHYYISYGALSANRIPCPPRSGRSYYTHDCFKARGPAHPYTRGCSKITRCRR